MRRLVPGLALMGLLAGSAAGGAEPPRAGSAAQVHEVLPGETLWQIAQNTVGDARLWPALYHANRDQIKDPARVYPGQRLAIPEIPASQRAAVRREARALDAP